MTDQPTGIFDALAAVMADVQAVAKRDKNNHQNFMFRGIDAVLNAVGPALRTHEVVVIPDVLDIHYDAVRTSQDKPATACRVTVAYRFYARDGSSVAATVPGEAWDSGDKATSKAMSVAFRTALLQALALPTDEPDPDNDTYERQDGEAAHPRESNKATDGQMRKLWALGNSYPRPKEYEQDVAGWLDKMALTVIGKPSHKDVTNPEASKLIDVIEDAKKAKEAEPQGAA